MEIAVRKFFLIELDQLAGGESLLHQLRAFALGPVAIHHLVRRGQRADLLYPPIDPGMSPCHAFNHNIWRPEPACIMM